MNIAVVGLGLIGGSFAKAISKNTNHIVYGFDIDQNTLNKAINDGAIKKTVALNDLIYMDMTIICLHPEGIIDFIRKNYIHFKKGSIVIDSCGVKEYIYDNINDFLCNKGVYFIGAHPMAGREFSGYDYSIASLFEGCSFILTPDESIPQKILKIVKDFALSIGSKEIIVTDPKTHDREIAYTSQLIHIVSNSYVKSPSLKNYRGFSAGSFQDFTRVAKLDATLWTSLFLKNKKALIDELDCLINHINDYKDAINNDDKETLLKLLNEGNQAKSEYILKK
jgi:prephenate dehydrogenase